MTTETTTSLPITEMLDKRRFELRQHKNIWWYSDWMMKNHVYLSDDTKVKIRELNRIIPQVRTMELSLIEKANNANEFIRDIAKLFGEDDLWKDGKSWSIDDFSDAIEKAKREERERIVGILHDMNWVPKPSYNQIIERITSDNQ